MTRAGVLRRDGRRCAYCGRRADTIDHVVPRSRGGGHTWENCVAACRLCNSKKADRLLGELGWTLDARRARPAAARAGCSCSRSNRCPHGSRGSQLLPSCAVIHPFANCTVTRCRQYDAPAPPF